MKLDKLKQIKDLRQVWPNEAKDFTPWLASDENLALLSEVIGVDMELIEKESAVGDFNLDILAKDKTTGRNIIIENQLEDTNHDHLGKIITYASGKNASVIIWIVKRARDEHRQAIEWLNLHTDDEAAFFLIEMELWQIGSSNYAPKFNIVERPNDWLRNIKNQDSLKPADKIKLAFWTAFKEYCLDLPDFEFSLRKPSTSHWYVFAIGKSSCNIQLTVDTRNRFITIGLHLKDEKELCDILKSQSKQIADILGQHPTFSGGAKESRMYITKKNINFNNQEEWNSYFEWFVSELPKMKKIADLYLL